LVKNTDGSFVDLSPTHALFIRHAGSVVETLGKQP
jgi:hypothetical protein